MASRAYWKGYLRLSLVTCPIELFPAVTQSEKTHFHQINTETGHRLRQQMVDETTGDVVDKQHKAVATSSRKDATSRSALRRSVHGERRRKAPARGDGRKKAVRRSRKAA